MPPYTLTPATFDGTNINDGVTYKSWFTLGDDPLHLLTLEPVEAEVPGPYWYPVAPRSQPKSYVLPLHVQLVSLEQPALNAFKTLFSPDKGDVLLTATAGDGGGYQLTVRVEDLPESGTNHFVAPLHRARPVFEKTTETTVIHDVVYSGETWQATEPPCPGPAACSPFRRFRSSAITPARALMGSDSLPREAGVPARVVVVRKMAEMEDALSIRRAVFIAEQGVTEAEEIDAYDGDPRLVTGAVHIVAYVDGRPAATGRLILDAPPPENAHIGRVAVLRQHRRRGLGRAIMRALEDEARRRGYRCATVAAQVRAMPFYESLGYVAHGDVFLDARIEHRMMERPL